MSQIGHKLTQKVSSRFLFLRLAGWPVYGEQLQTCDASTRPEAAIAFSFDKRSLTTLLRGDIDKWLSKQLVYRCRDNYVYRPMPISTTLEGALGFNLYRTAQLFRRELIRALVEYDLTPEQWQVMATLWSGAILAQTDIVDLTLKDKHSVSRIIGRLEKKGWVKKTADRNDGRITHIHVTATGMQFRDRVPAALEKHFAPIYESLTSDEYRHLLQTLKRLRTTLGDEPSSRP